MAKTLDYNFAVDKSLVADTGPTLTCTRSGDATYFDASGVMQTAGTNTARFDHDPGASNASLGLLIEEERTNLISWTETMDHFDWPDTSTTHTADTATAPDGAVTADEIKHSGAGGSLRRNLTGLTADADYTYSAFVKKGDTGGSAAWFRFSVYETADSANIVHQWFNVNTGAKGTTTLGGTGTSAGADIEDVGNGWYRVWSACSPNNSATALSLTISISDADASTGRDITNGLLIWGAQIELGSFPTSYIPNDSATASVTRAADVVSTTDVSWYNALGGSLYFAGSVITTTGTTSAYAVELSSNTSSNRIGLYRNPSVGDGAYAIVQEGGAAYYSPAAIAGIWTTTGTTHRSVMGFLEDDFKFYADGTAGATDTSGNVAAGISDFNVGSRYDEGKPWNGHIARIVYYDERLADSVLEDLSNGTFPSGQFPGNVAGDGGHIWPPRSNDPRWAQIISDSGITASGNFIDDVHAALEALGSTTGQLDTLWKKVKAANSVTDTSEPYLY